MAEDCGMYRRSQAPVRVVRGRGCNESFRAAVDKSYEGHHYQQHAMETRKCLLKFIILKITPR